jgi:hypothetical protein
MIGNKFFGLGSGIDADAQAFIDAAGITDPTQQSAITTLVVDLKADGLWSKMHAIYPFVGGTASTHKWNLKDPRDLDAAYRLDFNGTWTHDSNGAQNNAGTTHNADTHLNPNSVFGSNYAHQSWYNGRENTSGTIIQGCSQIGVFKRFDMGYDVGNTVPFAAIGNQNSTGGTDTSTLGFSLSYRTGSTTGKMLRNDVLKVTMTTTFTSYHTDNYGLGNRLPGAVSAQSIQYRFASIGDTMNDTDATNFYHAVQTYQTTLGRYEGVPIVSDSDAQAFLDQAVITDSTQATAIDNLVIGLKSDGLWTKMKAIYPFVGGTASTHKWNLKDPRDLDAAFRLTFVDINHSSDGIQTKLSTSVDYANTHLTPSSSLSLNSSHISIYSKTDNTDSTYLDMGAASSTAVNYIGLYCRTSTGSAYGRVYDAGYAFGSVPDSLGLFTASRTGATSISMYRNGSSVDDGTNSSVQLCDEPIYICTQNFNGSGGLNPNRVYAFATIGDGLNSTEVSNLYTRVQAYQTTLGRQVPDIVTGATVNLDAGNSSSYPGSGTTWSDLSGNGYDGVLQNGVGYSSSNDGYLIFDGTNDYIDGNDTPQVATNRAFTVEIWFNLDVIDTGSSPFRNLFTLETSGSNAFALAVTPTGFLSQYGTMTFGSATSFDQLKITDSISISTWYQAVITFTGSFPTEPSSYKFYLNSVSKTVSSADTFLGNTNTNSIGAELPSATNYIDGNISVFNLYDGKEFNQAEVTQNFNAYKNRYGL